MRLTNLGVVGMGVLTTLFYLLTQAPGFQVLFFFYFGLLVGRVFIAQPTQS
jgi:hypothetical protein